MSETTTDGKAALEHVGIGDLRPWPQYDGPACDTSADYDCTRPAGHAGPHIATMAPDGMVIDIWWQRDAPNA